MTPDFIPKRAFGSDQVRTHLHLYCFLLACLRQVNVSPPGELLVQVELRLTVTNKRDAVYHAVLGTPLHRSLVSCKRSSAPCKVVTKNSPMRYVLLCGFHSLFESTVAVDISACTLMWHACVTFSPKGDNARRNCRNVLQCMTLRR